MPTMASTAFEPPLPSPFELPRSGLVATRGYPSGPPFDAPHPQRRRCLSPNLPTRRNP